MRFADRRVDLAPWLEGFPYSGLFPAWEAGVLVYDERAPTGRTLRSTSLAAPELAGGAAVSPIDWDTRNRWGLKEHAGALWFQGDERNDERMNVYRLDFDGTLTALTDEPYVYGFSFGPEDRMAVIVRRGEQGAYTSCLETMKLDGSDRSEVLCDTPELTFTWSTPSWAPDGSGVVVRTNRGGRRDAANLSWLPFDAPQLHVVTDPVVDRTRAGAFLKWVDDETFLFTADDSGTGQLGRYHLPTGRLDWITAFERELSDAIRLGDQLLAVLHRPDEDQLVVLDLDGTERSRTPIDGTVRVLGDDESSRALLRITSTKTPFSVVQATVADGALTTTPFVGLAPEVESRLVQCNVEKVGFTTHDERELHAFLYTPKEAPETKTARVLSFYGGGNEFAEDIQVFCAAGIATLSPAVRGAWGFGTEFYRLNDGDLGGDEIVDVFEAARFLESKGYAADRIGVYGRSHGGYATMRAMTFPAGTNGHEAGAIFPFAFGLADAGFSDIVTFHDTCNIPDWVVLEAGDPATEADKLKDRSPLSHVDKLSAPILLQHGENDSRVPVAESRQFAEACAAAGKDCTYVEYAGEGHRVKSVANRVREYHERFTFLERVLD